MGSTSDKLRNLFESSQGLLRGIGDTSEDDLTQAATAILDAKALLKSRNDQVKLLKTQMKEGNSGAAAVTLKEMAQSQQDAVQSKSGLHAPLVPFDSTPFNAFNLQAYSEGVSPSELLEREQTLDVITDNTDVVVDFLEDVHVSVTSLKSRADANKVGGENNLDGSDSIFFGQSHL